MKIKCIVVTLHKSEVFLETTMAGNDLFGRKILGVCRLPFVKGAFHIVESCVMQNLTKVV